MIRIAPLVIALLMPVGQCYGWSDSGHHIIAVMAFDLLPANDRAELLRLLSAHPRFVEDFSPPDSITETDVDHWRIGTAACWPDMARRQPRFNRPTWHYQLGATLTIWDRSSVNIPETPGPLPEDATLETQQLYIAQAVELCRSVLADEACADADRALAICWLGHLVGDAHQPCHAGSLYAEEVFPEGDRGANLIPVRQGRNLHALWDGLLGRRYDQGDVRRRIAEITSDVQLIRKAKVAASTLDALKPATWLTESRRYGVEVVYSPDVLDAVSASRRGLTDGVTSIDLPEDYLKRAGAVARVRAAQAAHRLAGVWTVALDGEE